MTRGRESVITVKTYTRSLALIRNGSLAFTRRRGRGRAAAAARFGDFRHPERARPISPRRNGFGLDVRTIPNIGRAVGAREQRRRQQYRFGGWQTGVPARRRWLLLLGRRWFRWQYPSGAIIHRSRTLVHRSAAAPAAAAVVGGGSEWACGGRCERDEFRVRSLERWWSNTRTHGT